MRAKPALSYAIVVLGIAGGSFLYGFLAQQYGWFPSRRLNRIEDRVLEVREHLMPSPPPPDPVIATGLLRLNLHSLHVPTTRVINNGSLTDVGKGMLVLTGSGEVFHYAPGTNTVVRTAIALPPNHAAEYAAIAGTAKYAGYRRDSYSELRYTHLLHVQDDAADLLFVSYLDWNAAEECYTSTIARLDLPAQPEDASRWSVQPQDWRVIFRSRPCLPLKKKMRAIEAHESGGRMVFDAATRRLVFTIGDFHWDGVFNDTQLAQDDENDFGKVLSIDLDGGNPRHIAKGLRNAQGITFDRDHRLWITEHGPKGGDELNLVEPDANFGWPLATLGKGYNGLPWKPAHQYGRHDEFVAPIYAWLPSVAVSSIMQVHGFHPAWDGDFLVGSLAGTTLYRVRVVDKRVLFAEPIPIGERIRYILQPEDGVIALWTDSQNLILLTRAPDDDSSSYVEHFISSREWTEDRREAARGAVATCLQCHTYTPTPGSAAPHLVGVYNRPVAATAFPRYSSALLGLGGRWTVERLTAYLVNPQGVAPGCLMAQLGLKEETAGDVVQVLKALDSAN